MSKRKATNFTSDSEGNVFNSYKDEENVICLSSDSEDSGSVTIIETRAPPSNKIKAAICASLRYAKNVSNASSLKQERHRKSYPCSSSVSIPKNVTKEHTRKKAASPTSIAQDMKTASLPSDFTLKAIEEASDEEKKENDVFRNKLSNFLV